MVIRVETYDMGYKVRLTGRDGQDFSACLREFKEQIPARCRTFVGAASPYWHVDRRAARFLERFLSNCQTGYRAPVFFDGQERRAA